MTLQQTGAEPTAIYSEALSNQLQRMAVRLGLDTAATEELTLLVSTATESRLLNTTQGREMLMNGLKAFASTMNDTRILDGLVAAALQAEPMIRYATVERKPGKPTRVTAYLGR